MAEGWNHFGQTGHSQNNSPRYTGSGPEQNRGYHAQPESAGMQSLATDTSPSLGLVPCSTYDGQPTSQDISYPPSVGLSTEEPVQGRANELGIYCQSVSGCSSYGMNRQPDGHPIAFPTATSTPEQMFGRHDDRNIQQLTNLRLTESPVQTRPPSRLLEDLLAHEQYPEKRALYMRVVQQLQEVNISHDAMFNVAVQNGIKCFASRSTFFQIYDEDASSIDLSDKSLESSVNEYVTVPMTSATTNQYSFEPVVTRANSAAPRYPVYRDRNARLRTYNCWPGKHQTPEELCDAGFIFTGKGDICRCFHCGLTIWKWEFGDNPVYEHFRVRQDCSFASQLSRLQHLPPLPQEICGQDTSELNMRGNRICQACKENEIGVAQYKCGHIVCASCAPVERANGEKRYCKICRHEVESTSAYDRTAL